MAALGCLVITVENDYAATGGSVQRIIHYRAADQSGVPSLCAQPRAGPRLFFVHVVGSVLSLAGIAGLFVYGLPGGRDLAVGIALSWPVERQPAHTIDGVFQQGCFGCGGFVRSLQINDSVEFSADHTLASQNPGYFRQIRSFKIDRDRQGFLSDPALTQPSNRFFVRQAGNNELLSQLNSAQCFVVAFFLESLCDKQWSSDLIGIA